MSDALPKLPVPVELIQQMDQLSTTEQAFMAGYLWAKSQANSAPTLAPAAANESARKITVLSASQTGNAASVAKQLSERLRAESLDVTLVSAGDYKARQLAKEDIVVIVTSTQGEGEPPEEAVPLHHFLFGKRAPKMDTTSFAVFGLGDRSYPDFCQAGIDFDTKLAELGATRILDRVDADIDYQSAADAWLDNAVAKLKEVVGSSNKAVGSSLGSSASSVVPFTAVSSATAVSEYSKENPYTASLIVHHDLATEDADKEVAHIEIDLGDSNITYQAGDALGIYTINDQAAVDAVLDIVGLSADESVVVKEETITLEKALLEHFDLNQLLPAFVQDYAEKLDKPELKTLLADSETKNDFIAWTNLATLLETYPLAITAQQLVDGLKALTPRLYSIASAQEEVGEEVHLCVGVVDMPRGDTVDYGSASSLVSKRLDEGDKLRVFVEENPRFRLPQNSDTPIIMIGAGTGIAPYRSFMQQRSADGAEGKNWLIFGNRRFRKDFLYQAEWLSYRDQGLLSDVSLAWSRDHEEKVYVQHKITENAEQFWQWLQDGAHVYVCGDAIRMAKDVEKAIIEVIKEHGNMDDDNAMDYLNDLREDDRYQRDVY